MIVDPKTAEEMFGFKRARELDNRDHPFAKWLRDHSWSEEWKRFGRSNHFFNTRGEAIAVATYDNSACTTKVWVRKEDADE